MLIKGFNVRVRTNLQEKWKKKKALLNKIFSQYGLLERLGKLI